MQQEALVNLIIKSVHGTHPLQIYNSTSLPPDLALHLSRKNVNMNMHTFICNVLNLCAWFINIYTHTYVYMYIYENRCCSPVKKEIVNLQCLSMLDIPA